jgi:hypothetical protein
MIWFDKDHPQQLTLKTFTCLVGKAPTKSKRLRMGFTLDLSYGDVKGMPDWMMEARDFVMRTGQTVTENIAAPGINMIFGDPNLFKKKPVEAPKADLRKFVVYAAGTDDDPETLVSFIAYSQFSTDLNRWLGQMAGETFTATFEGVVPEPGDIVLKSADAEEDEDEDDDDEEEMEGEEDELQAQERRRLAHVAKDNAAAAAPTPAQVARAKSRLEVM